MSIKPYRPRQTDEKCQVGEVDTACRMTNRPIPKWFHRGLIDRPKTISVMRRAGKLAESVSETGWESALTLETFRKALDDCKLTHTEFVSIMVELLRGRREDGVPVPPAVQVNLMKIFLELEGLLKPAGVNINIQQNKLFVQDPGEFFNELVKSKGWLNEIEAGEPKEEEDAS